MSEHRTNMELLISDPLADEVSNVLSRSRVRQRFPAGTLGVQTVAEVAASAVRVDLPTIPSICRDPKDDMVIATAIYGGAQFIATEDKDLLDLVEYQGIRVITGRELLEILRDRND